MADKLFMSSTRLPIDVGDKPTSALVLRDGLQIKAPILEKSKITDLIGKLFPADRAKIPRVLQQGIAPGVKVARGTVIDVTLVPPIDIKVGLLETSHVSLRDKTVSAVAAKITDDVAKILSDHQTSTTLNPDEKVKVDAVLTQLGATISNASAEQTYETAFQTLRDVQVFR